MFAKLANKFMVNQDIYPTLGSKSTKPRILAHQKLALKSKSM